MMKQNVRNNPKLSLRGRSQRLDLTYGSARRILRKDLDSTGSRVEAT